MPLPIDLCYYCGKVIPEGRYVCNECEKTYFEPVDCVNYAETNQCNIMGCDCIGCNCKMYEKGRF